MPATTDQADREPSKRDKVRTLASQRGALRMADFTSLGVSREYVSDLVKRGDLTRLGRGLFALPGFDRSENHALVEVATHSPRSIICLISALQFHGLTTQLPSYVWVALPNHIAAPRVPTVGVEVVHMSRIGLESGVEYHDIEGVKVPIFSAAKTVADCFKFRSRVTTGVAVEALRDCLEKRQATRAEIISYAKLLRSWRILRPYMEAVQ